MTYIYTALGQPNVTISKVPPTCLIAIGRRPYIVLRLAEAV